MGNADLLETKQIIYHSKDIDETYPKTRGGGKQLPTPNSFRVRMNGQTYILKSHDP